ncbi:MAG TPA: hypothetical protein VFT72_14935 [Opitutaceae bacterium]|nr:hypothetical protein [Opitutaceae bacterium]
MIPTTLYRATSAKASVKSRLAAVSRSTNTETTGFGRVVAPREIKRSAAVATGVQRSPSFAKIFASGGLTLKQAQRLMADAALEPIAGESPVIYQRPSVALHHYSAAVLCGMIALIVGTFFSLLVN